MRYDEIIAFAGSRGLSEQADVESDATANPEWCRWVFDPKRQTYELAKAGLMRSLLSNDEVRTVRHAMSSRKAALRLPTEAVPTKSIRPTQHFVYSGIVHELRDAGPEARERAKEPVIMFRKNGTVQVADGHHGLVAALLRSDPTFAGRMIDFDKADPEEEDVD